MLSLDWRLERIHAQRSLWLQKSGRYLWGVGQRYPLLTTHKDSFHGSNVYKCLLTLTSFSCGLERVICFIYFIRQVKMSVRAWAEYILYLTCACLKCSPVIHSRKDALLCAYHGSIMKFFLIPSQLLQLFLLGSGIQVNCGCHWFSSQDHDSISPGSRVDYTRLHWAQAGPIFTPCTSSSCTFGAPIKKDYFDGLDKSKECSEN